MSPGTVCLMCVGPERDLPLRRGTLVAAVLIADLSHYDGANPEVHPVAWRLAEYLRDIVRCATALPAGCQYHTGLRCHCRPARRACPGHLVVARQDVPAEISWNCSSCGDAGVITGWRGSFCDLSPSRPHFESPPLTVEITDDDHRLLRGLTVLDTEGMRIVYGALRDERGRLFLTGDEDEIEDLAGLVAAEANHAERRDRERRLDLVYARLSDALGGG